ncbi:twin-arginine translocation signal domain-containing protein, partial [Vibrio parahaemolyticus]
MPRAALPRLSRRSVLVGAGAAGGLVAAAVLIGPGARPALPLRPGQHLVDAMIRLDRDGSLSVGIPA